MNEYKDYGYFHSNKSCTNAYLSEPVLELLSFERNKTILDLGCGNGWLSSLLISKGFNVYGTDASTSGIDIARKNHPDRFFVQDLSTDSLPSGISNIRFDTVISTEVIEHLYNPGKFLDFIKQVLQSNGGGELILSTPYHGYFKNLLIALSGNTDVHYSPLWEGGHIKFWSFKTLTAILEEHNFKIINIKGCGRLPYLWKSMLIKAKL